MEIKPHKKNKQEIAEILSEVRLIGTVEEGLNLLGEVYYQGFDKVIIHQKNIAPDFFDLKNQIAGEILQKFSNYRVQLAIVGDFSVYKSQSLKEFIYESNKGSHVNFVSSVDEALAKLAN